MNYMIIISFIVFVAMVVVAIFPKQTALRIAGVNKYDLESVPKVLVYVVFFTSIVFMVISLFILLFETSLIITDVSEITQWYESVFGEIIG